MQRLLEAGSRAALFARLKPSAAQMRVLRGLWPYLWPSDRPELKATVLVSLLLVLAAKVVTVAMPFTFK